MGSSKKQKTGNRYYMGSALVVCRQADALLSIRTSDGKRIFDGAQSQGSVNINKPDAFGGDEREGGFSGKLNVNLGGNTQPINTYLRNVLGSLTSAMRGVVSLVYNQPYVSANTARLPVLWHKMLNVSGIHRGWLVDKALISPDSGITAASIYMALDMSLSMTTVRIATQNAAIAAFIRSLKGTVNNIKVVTHSADIIDSIERFDCNNADYEDVAVWVEALTVNDTVFGGNWDNAVSQAAAFFTSAESVQREFGSVSLVDATSRNISAGEVVSDLRRIVIFTTDGAPTGSTSDDAAATLSAIDRVEVACFNIENSNTTETEKLDNTASDGVPVVSGDDPEELLRSLNFTFTSWVDMNPIHIIRCLRSDPVRGGTVDEADFGDTWEPAANKFFDRNFGLSPKFRGVDQVLEDIQEIERHADVVSYPSLRTGKWEIAVIDDDFVLADIPTLDRSIVMDWSGLTKPQASETPNQLLVNYTKRENGETGSVQRTNPAGVRRQGRVIKAQPANYPAVTRAALATRLCLRDLRSISKELYTGTLPLTYLPPNVEIGSRVILLEPDLRINIVAVVTEIRHGESTNAQAWITVSEDKYSAPEVPDDLEFGEPAVEDVLPVTNRLVTESSYYAGVIFNGQSATDQELADEPDLGRLIVAGAAPDGRHIDFSIGLNVGSGLTDAGLGEFQSYAITLTEIPAKADFTVFDIADNQTLIGFEAGSLAAIGDEIVRVDSMAVVNDVLQVTVGRGCLDTTPKEHAVGAAMILVSTTEPQDEEYIASQSVDVRLLSRTGSAKLPIFQAPEDTVIFASRAIRPYAPGRFQANGSYSSDVYYADIVLSWVGRDRTIQTTPNVEDHTFSGIGPEMGVTYRLVVDALDFEKVDISNVLDSNIGTVETYDWDDATVLPAGTDFLRFRLYSVRDGYDSFQPAELILRTFELVAPGNLTAVVS